MKARGLGDTLRVVQGTGYLERSLDRPYTQPYARGGAL